MKYYLTILLLIVSCAVKAAESSTNHLAIYLVDTQILDHWPTGSPDSLKTLSRPVLADSDFVSFDVTNHTFAITAAAAKRLARSIWELGWTNAPTILRGGAYELIPAPAPFVLKAMGHPVYEGAFYTEASSSSFSGPVVLSDVMFINTNLTEPVSFRIELGYPVTNPGVTDRVDLGYALTSLKVTDPREDIRIKVAAQHIFDSDKK